MQRYTPVRDGASPDFRVPSLFMASQKMELGPCGVRLAKNVQRARRLNEMGVSELSEALAVCGRPIGASALSKIEQGIRRVDTDDLVALSLALGAPVSWLLTNEPRGVGADVVELTPRIQLTRAEIFGWFTQTALNPDAASARVEQFRGRAYLQGIRDRHAREQAEALTGERDKPKRSRRG